VVSLIGEWFTALTEALIEEAIKVFEIRNPEQQKRLVARRER
jgi:hypothetical protein